MKRLVAIGSTKGHDYSAFLPIVGAYWRDRIGYQPEFFLIGIPDEWEQGHTAVVLDALEMLGLNFTYVSHIQDVEDATISQCVRQHAAAHPFFAPTDLLICSDADLVPLRKDFYYQHETEKYEIGLYYSNGYPGEKDHYPSCHMSMSVANWRQVMRLDLPLDAALKRNFSDYGLAQKMDAKKADPAKNWGHVWFADELIASKRIVESGKSLQMIPREGHPPVDRLDRACWPNQYDARTLTDCHSIRPIWSAPNWPRFRPLIEQTVPAILSWADQYILEFRKAMGVDQ